MSEPQLCSSDLLFTPVVFGFLNFRSSVVTSVIFVEGEIVVLCGGLIENDPLEAHMLECFIHSQWNCLGRIRKCGLIGGGVLLRGGP